ncbi:MAG: F0F1 ATP synthase subunit gamma [bacterium]|nr:F0F1 ATP synthase subunit gamma [bacterium]
MLSRKILAMENESLVGLRGFVEVYEEIAAERMQKIRSAVLKAREFLQGLAEIFAEVKLTYVKEVGALVAQSKINRNGKTVAVFLSANSGLFGDIVERIFRKFTEFLAGNKAEVVIIGKQGLRMLQDRHPEILYNYFDLSDDSVDLDSLRLIMRYLLQFEKIIVFYGKFENIINQNPTVSSISGDSLPNVNLDNKPQNKYLFEPTVKEILEVFESEILSSIFEQVMHESLLAKFASRLQHLDRSLQNIEERLVSLKFELVRWRHKIDNRKQLSTLSGISIWEQSR